jgi:ribosomal protein L37AE/L43A
MLYKIQDEPDDQYECDCGEEITEGRWALGYNTCLKCGETIAKQVKRCVVPLNKSNYYLVTDREILKQLNPKRTT